MHFQQPDKFVEAILFGLLTLGMVALYWYTRASPKSEEQQWRWSSLTYALAYTLFAVQHYCLALRPLHQEPTSAEWLGWAATSVFSITVLCQLFIQGHRRRHPRESHNLIK